MTTTKVDKKKLLSLSLLFSSSQPALELMRWWYATVTLDCALRRAVCTWGRLVRGVVTMVVRPRLLSSIIMRCMHFKEKNPLGWLYNDDEEDINIIVVLVGIFLSPATIHLIPLCYDSLHELWSCTLRTKNTGRNQCLRGINIVSLTSSRATESQTWIEAPNHELQRNESYISLVLVVGWLDLHKAARVQPSIFICNHLRWDNDEVYVRFLLCLLVQFVQLK